MKVPAGTYRAIRVAMTCSMPAEALPWVKFEGSSVATALWGGVVGGQTLRVKVTAWVAEEVSRPVKIEYEVNNGSRTVETDVLELVSVAEAKPQ